MMKTLNTILILLIALVFSSCEDVIDIKEPEGKDALVVEGWLTDRPQLHRVKLYLTKKLSDNSSYTMITGAKLVLSDNHGNTETLQEVSAGNYEIKTLKSVAGYVYTLNIESSKGNYQAVASTPRLSLPPDSLTYKYEEKSGIYDDPGYYPHFHGQEMAGTGDYIQMRLYRNGIYLNKANDFNIFSDEFVDGNYIGDTELAVDKPFQKGEVGKVEVWSLSEDAFKFWIDIQTQLQNGQIFATPFANARTDVKKTSEGAMDVVGYFGSSIVRSAEKKVE